MNIEDGWSSKKNIKRGWSGKMDEQSWMMNIISLVQGSKIYKILMKKNNEKIKY